MGDPLGDPTAVLAAATDRAAMTAAIHAPNNVHILVPVSTRHHPEPHTHALNRAPYASPLACCLIADCPRAPPDVLAAVLCCCHECLVGVAKLMVALIPLTQTL